MKEIVIRLYDPNEIPYCDKSGKRIKAHYFDMSVDGTLYSGMKHLNLDITDPRPDEHRCINWDNWCVSMQIEKDFDWTDN